MSDLLNIHEQVTYFPQETDIETKREHISQLLKYQEDPETYIKESMAQFI